MIRDGHPVLVENDLRCTALERLKLEQSPEEGWLQQVLDRAPELLPIADIDDRLQAGLVSLGREVSIPVGSIDNLFISRNGYVVVVETKLWRNPEARRQVVAQLLDYATHVRKWRYDDLEQIAHTKGHLELQSLWELVQPDLQETEWRDQVDENLRRGRMTLAVVGDGIRSEVEALAEVVSGHPDFQFRLALVEMRLFSVPGGARLVVPIAVTKTAEVERAVVRVEYVGRAEPTVTVGTPAPEDAEARRGSLSAQALFDELRRLKPSGDAAANVASRVLGLITDPLQVSWGAGSFAVKAPDPSGSERLLSLCVVSRTGVLYAYVSWLQDQLADLWQDAEAVKEVTNAHIALLKKYGATPTPTGKQYNVDLRSLAGKEEQFVADLQSLVARITTRALRG